MSVSEAAESGDVDRLRTLLDAGGDPNEKETEEHWPPLLEAAYHDQVEAARLLLDAGADMYRPTDGGETPLLMAVQCGSVGVFRLLVERGGQMNADRGKAAWMLTQAAGGGHLEIVRWLLVQGIDVDATDDSGCTALTYAAVNDRLEMVEALMFAGADVNHRDNDTETVLMWAADHAGNAEFLLALLQNGANVNLKNDFDHTALSCRSSEKQSHFFLYQQCGIVESFIKTTELKAAMPIELDGRIIDILGFQPQTARLHGLSESIYGLKQPFSYPLATRGRHHIKMPQEYAPVPGDILSRCKARQFPVFFGNSRVVPVPAFFGIRWIEIVMLPQRWIHHFFHQPKREFFSHWAIDALRCECRIHAG